MLARLPDTDPAPIVHVLERFLQDHTRDPVEQVAPDVQAALTLIGALPRSGTLDLKRAIIVGADLRGLDFSDSKLTFARFRDCLAAGLKLRRADLAASRLENVQADRADFTDANLSSAYLERVLLRNAAMAGVNMANATLHEVDFSDANLQDAILPSRKPSMARQYVTFDESDTADATFREVSLGRPGRRPSSADDALPGQHGDIAGPHAGSILVVDDDADWLELIRRSLPQYQVDLVQAYDDALEALRRGRSYDVAIVDLNLLNASNISSRDLLGGDILKLLRANYPATRRIALTGLSPASVKREVLDRYDVDDLMLKQGLKLSDIRSLVRAAVATRIADSPSGLTAEKSYLSDDFVMWCTSRSARFRQQAKLLQDALREAGPLAPGGPEAELTWRRLPFLSIAFSPPKTNPDTNPVCKNHTNSVVQSITGN